MGYFYLAQYYAPRLVGNDKAACVPIYTEPTTKETKGKPRATNAEVYKQIDTDLAAAIDRMKKAKATRDSKSHLGLAEVYGWAARVALAEEKWKDAQTYAENAIRSEEHTSELQSRQYLVCRLLLEKKKNIDAIL